MVEVTIILKSSDKTYKQKFLHYNNEKCIEMTNIDPVLSEMVQEAKQNFKGEAEDVIIKTNFVW